MLRKLAVHKYKLAIFLLLLAASAVSIFLADARMAYSNTSDYSALVWNLGLAWIPFVFASIAYVVSWSRKLLYVIVPICAFV